MTRATFKDLVGTRLELVAPPPLDEIFRALYRRNLSGLLSEAEAIRTFAIQLLMRGKFDEVRPRSRSFSRNYVFKVTSPRFHATDACEYLQADFVNYEVPPEIKQLGEARVRDFQAFCDEHRALLRSAEPAVFWAHVGAHFGVPIKNVQEVRRLNSGVQTLDELDVDELRQHVDRLIDDALALIEDDTLGRQLRAVRFAAVPERAIAAVPDTDARRAVESLFELKRSIIDSLTALFARQAGATGYLLPETLLRAAGLDACRGCVAPEPVEITWLE